jgi:hypothetical protein
MRSLVPVALAARLLIACTPSAVTPVPDASDAAPGTLHTYVCPVIDGGPSWACTDGINTPVGTCASYGCRPVDTTSVTVTHSPGGTGTRVPVCDVRGQVGCLLRRRMQLEREPDHDRMLLGLWAVRGCVLSP